MYMGYMQDWAPKEIEAFRKTHNLTRRALGELVGVTVNCIYQWERGLRQPSKTTKILLSRIASEIETKGR
jgi:DNA-binding transcriptional regulator YiaG